MEIKQNALTIAAEIAWMAAVINTRLKLHFNDNPPHAAIQQVPVPDLSADPSLYAAEVNKLALSFNERLMLILALAPHVQPESLDIFFTKNINYDRSFTEFGGIRGKNHSGFIPTGETVLFILAGNDIGARMDVLHLMHSSSLFGPSGLLKLFPAEPGEPASSGVLALAEDYVRLFIAGENNKPDFNAFFPAKLSTTTMNWDELVLEDHIMEDIAEIRAWIEHGQTLLQNEHIRRRFKPGYRSLFYGPPGTGKTLTACLLGKVTGCDVYRIDLSMVVSKYIGETEKNLAVVFDQAESRNWILFFDEADALFGKRTQTGSSNDRYANQEVAYLLQRIEDFSGVAILASNLKSNIDEAFARRFQSMIHFPMPGFDERLRLWQYAFSDVLAAGTPLDFKEIARNYTLSGGAIMNVYRYCTLLALRRKQPEMVMEDVITGIRREFRKEGKTI